MTATDGRQGTGCSVCSVFTHVYVLSLLSRRVMSFLQWWVQHAFKKSYCVPVFALG